MESQAPSCPASCRVAYNRRSVRGDNNNGAATGSLQKVSPISMNRRSTVTKTGKGLMEATGKTDNLSRDLRDVLKEIDGQVSFSTLLNALDRYTEPELLEALRGLEREGYVREFVGQQDGGPASRPVPRSPGSPAAGGARDDLDFTSLGSAPVARNADAANPKTGTHGQVSTDALDRARREAEERARRDVQEKARREAEERIRKDAEERTKREAEEKARRSAEERLRRETEEKARREAEARARREAEERARKEAEERARKEAETRARRDPVEQAQRDEEERAKRQIEERARREQELRLRMEEEERKRREEKERAQRGKQDRQPLGALGPSLKELEERERSEAEQQSRRQEERGREEERRRKDEAERAQRNEQERQVREALERAQREQEEKERREADEKVRREEESEREEREERERHEKERERKESEEQERREAEDRARAEEEARRKEEEKRAKEEEARRKEEEKRAKEEEKKAKAEAKARAKAEAKAAALARKEAREKEKAEREEARRRAKAAERAEDAGRPAREVWARRRSSRSLGKPIAAALLVVVLCAVAAIPFLPIDPAPYEKAAQDWLGEPVELGSVKLSLIPSPQLRFEKVVIGKVSQMRISAISASPEIGFLMGDRRAFKSIELEGATVPREFLSVLLSEKGRGESLHIERVVAKGLKLDIPELNVPALDLSAKLGLDGALRSVTLSNGERRLSLTLQPRGGRASIEMSAGVLPLPIGSNLALEDFSAKGTVTASGLALNEFEARAFDGVLKGSARLRWSGGWSLEGEITARRMQAARIAAPIIAGGLLEGKGTYSMTARTVDKLFSSARIEGNFTLQKGSITNVDMTRLLQGSSSGGGTTVFSELSGNVSADPNRLQVRQLRLVAGLLSGSGLMEMDPQQNLSGRMQLELRAQSVQARATLAVSGTLKNPQFRRSN